MYGLLIITQIGRAVEVAVVHNIALDVGPKLDGFVLYEVMAVYLQPQLCRQFEEWKRPSDSLA